MILQPMLHVTECTTFWIIQVGNVSSTFLNEKSVFFTWLTKTKYDTTVLHLNTNLVMSFLLKNVTNITKLLKLVPLGFQVTALSKRELHEGNSNSVFHRSLLIFAARIVIKLFANDSNKLLDLDIKLCTTRISSRMKFKTIYRRRELKSWFKIT